MQIILKYKTTIIIALIFLASFAYATQRTILGLNWTVIDGKLKTKLDVDLPGDLFVNGI